MFKCFLTIFSLGVPATSCEVRKITALKDIFSNSQSANIYSLGGAFEQQNRAYVMENLNTGQVVLKSLNAPGFRGAAQGMLKYRDPQSS